MTDFRSTAEARASYPATHYPLKFKKLFNSPKTFFVGGRVAREICFWLCSVSLLHPFSAVCIHVRFFLVVCLCAPLLSQIAAISDCSDLIYTPGHRAPSTSIVAMVSSLSPTTQRLSSGGFLGKSMREGALGLALDESLRYTTTTTKIDRLVVVSAVVRCPDILLV